MVGIEMGAGPIQSLQFRYVLDPNETNQFSKYQMATSINSCNSADVVQSASNGSATEVGNDSSVGNNIVPQAVSKLREVRVQVVSLSTQPDLATNLSTLQIGYVTPPFESSLWTPDGGSLTDAGPSATTLSDPYPRRAFNVRVVPRAIQGARL